MAHGVLQVATVDEMLAIALDEARRGRDEGGIPVGAALFDGDGVLLGRGHNRRVQQSDPSSHGETDAFRNAGRRLTYRDTTMVTTLAPCWYCSGLIRQFSIGRVLVGDAQNFEGGIGWLADAGVDVVVVDDPACIELMRGWIREHPTLWNEDIGEVPGG